MIDSYDLTVFTAIYAVIEICGILLAADAVMRPRSSQAAIAWSIALVTLPIATIPFYLIFGRTRFQGYAEAVREKESLVEDHLQGWYSQMNATASEMVSGLQGVMNLAQGLTDVPFTRGNCVELLLDGEATYRSMLRSVEEAESYIFVQFYIVKDGEVSRRLRDGLIQKARTGVQVYFLYDEIGCWNLSAEFLESMRKESINVSGFKTTQGHRNRFQINFRNHRKLLIVDGKTGFIGGHNLADEYLNYRDTHLKIEGPAAQHIQLTFLKDWYWATRQIPKVTTQLQSTLPGSQDVAIVNTGPADTKTNCSVLFATLFHSARKRLWLTSPYFVPDDVMVRALQAAAIRGVDVRIILPGKADHFFVELASYTYYTKMMNCGVRFFRYQEKFLHQKVVLVDHNLAGVGTVNLDNRSLYLNFEATALVADKGFVESIEAALEADLKLCEPVLRVHFADKPLYFRIGAQVARLASPLL